MKTQIRIFLVIMVTLLLSAQSFAHCPAAVKEEKVCLMFDGSMVYIYDQKLEHNGPYKDFKSVAISEIKSVKNEKINFTKTARGIYKLEVPQTSAIVLDVKIKDKIKSIRVVKE